MDDIGMPCQQNGKLELLTSSAAMRDSKGVGMNERVVDCLDESRDDGVRTGGRLCKPVQNAAGKQASDSRAVVEPFTRVATIVQAGDRVVSR